MDCSARAEVILSTSMRTGAGAGSDGASASLLWEDACPRCTIEAMGSCFFMTKFYHGDAPRGKRRRSLIYLLPPFGQ